MARVLPLRLLLALFAVSATAVPGRAQTGSFARFLGGGPARTDCMLVADVVGAGAGRMPRCTDGDPSCDADGVVDGTCRFTVRLCLDAVDAARPRCHADVVTGVNATEPALSAALRAMPLPVSLPETCTTTVGVSVARPGRRGRLVVRASAGMASGHSDRDRLAFVCRRPPPPVTLDTIQRRIFTPGCASFSCHGVARAGDLSLADGESRASLVGVPPWNPVARDAGLLRVAPGDPDRSFLLRKLAGPLRTGEGEHMPRVGASLGATQIGLIRGWIIAGAP